MCGDRGLLPFVDMELENVRASVVTDDIEVHFPADDLGAVDFGDEDDFVFKIGAGEKIAKRIDDATAAARDDGVWLVAERRAIVCGKVATAIELIAGENEAAAFDGDVAHGGEPGIARVSSGRAVEFDTFCVHGRAHQRQIVFPADDCAEFAEWRVVDRHG